MTFLRSIILAGIVLAAGTPATAFDHPTTPWNPRTYACPRTGTPPLIDGILDDPAWLQAPWTDPFVDIEGQARPVTPRHQTRTRLLWDDTALYIAAALVEPHVWGTVAERDAVIFADNDFEVFIDPDGDHHLYGELEINALGTVWDLLLVRPYRDGGPAINGWDMGGLQSAVHVEGTLNDPRDTDRGWSVELAIPWSALADLAGDRACPPEPGDTWRLNFSRVQWEHRIEDDRYVKTPIEGRGWQGEDNWVWSPQGLVAMHAPERWGFVTFVETATEAVPDPREALRPWYERLMQTYYAQRQRHEEDGHFAGRLPGIGDRVHIEHTTDTFTATLVDSAGTAWTVDQEGRLTSR